MKMNVELGDVNRNVQLNFDDLDAGEGFMVGNTVYMAILPPEVKRLEIEEFMYLDLGTGRLVDATMAKELFNSEAIHAFIDFKVTLDLRG